LNDAQVPEIGPATGTAGPAQGQQLPRAPDKRPHFGTFSLHQLEKNPAGS
jgi:hypothetical protein